MKVVYVALIGDLSMAADKCVKSEEDKTNGFDDLSNIFEGYKKQLFWAGFVLLGVYIGLQLLRSSTYEWGVFGKFSPERLGQLGDYIGGILNPLVAFFALMALFKTSQLQAKLTGEQLENEQKRTEEANERAKKLERKSQEQEKQANFMRMYEAYLSTVNNCRGNRKTKGGMRYTATGKMFFNSICNRGIIKILCTIPSTSTSTSVIEKTPDVVYYDKTIIKILPLYSSDPKGWASALREIEGRVLSSGFLSLEPFFRMTFHLLKRELAQEGLQKYENIRFFRAQLTEDELILLAINILFNHEGREGLAVVAEKSGLFKHLKAENLERLIKREYPDSYLGFFDIKVTEETLKKEAYVMTSQEK